MSSPSPAKHTYDPAQMNVFKGANSLIDYFNPDKNAPLPLVELPRELNPFYDDGVRIYAKMLTALPATNVKSLPGKLRFSKKKDRCGARVDRVVRCVGTQGRPSMPVPNEGSR